MHIASQCFFLGGGRMSEGLPMSDTPCGQASVKLSSPTDMVAILSDPLSSLPS